MARGLMRELAAWDSVGEATSLLVEQLEAAHGARMRKRLARSGLSDEESGEAWNRVLLLAVRGKFENASFASQEHRDRWAMLCAWRQRRFQLAARRRPAKRMYFEDEARIREIERNREGRVRACAVANEFGEVRRMDGWRAELAVALGNLSRKRREAVEARVVRDVQDRDGRSECGAAYWNNLRSGLAVLRHALAGSECERLAVAAGAGPRPPDPMQLQREKRARVREEKARAPVTA